MMLKFGVGILLLLNASLLAWQWGLMTPWGFDPHGHREPARLAQQIKPQDLLVTPLRPKTPDPTPTLAWPSSGSDASAAAPSAAAPSSQP